MVFISFIAFIHGDLFFSKTAADIHTDGSQNSSSLLLFLTFAVHSTALNNGAFDSSSLLNFLNEKRGRSFLLGDLRQLGFFNEHIAVHSRSTSSRYNCCIYFLNLDSSIRLQQFACMFRDKASCRVTLILREEYSLLFGWAIRQ